MPVAPVEAPVGRVRDPSSTIPRSARPTGWRRGRRALPWLVGVVISLAALVWVGLRVDPAPLPALQLQAGSVSSVALPADLPAPVARFYRTVYGDSVPVVDTAVISGRGTMRISGITLPARFRFSHITGEAYRHHIQTTIFGTRLLTVDEWFVEGTGRLQLPFGVSQGPQIDQGANLALWAEAVWMPSVWVSDDRAVWEAVDEDTARLLVPFGEETEAFAVSFDADTGLLQRMESMRFKAEGATTKTLWINEVVEWGDLDGQLVPLVTTVAWADEGSPWAVLRTEDIHRNADLSTYIQQSGP